MSQPHYLPGKIAYAVQVISVGVTRDVRIWLEGSNDDIWLSAEQFLALLDWGKENRERIEQMAKERAAFDEEERNR